MRMVPLGDDDSIRDGSVLRSCIFWVLAATSLLSRPVITFRYVSSLFMI
jgi:hypothetical protein